MLPYLAIIPVAVDVGDVDALALVNIQAVATALLDREASDCHVAAPIERALVVLLMPEVNPHPPFRLRILRIVQIIHLHSLSSFTQTRGVPVSPISEIARSHLPHADRRAALAHDADIVRRNHAQHRVVTAVKARVLPRPPACPAALGVQEGIRLEAEHAANAAPSV